MSKRCMGCMESYGNEFEICPHCGYVEGTEAEEAIHMDPGTLLHNRYIIGKVLGFGGFGVTYIAWDGKLEQKVAVKEYLPSEFSTRMPGQSCVTIFNGDKGEQFNDGMIRFLEEAKRLAKFQNEQGIVKVYDSFSENDTAYIVMEYLDGETLTERLKRDKTIPENEAVEMLIPLMQSLHTVHQEGILHRDIAPDNIFITKSGEVKLIDFGASRYATTSHSRSLTVIIKPGYSPEEQYRSRGDQGAYTDVYALAATLYKMITGKTPPDAMERRAKYENSNKDILEEPHKINKKISLNRENAILNAMNVRIEDRTPDVATFMKELDANPPAKRIYGKIKKLDVYALPLWIKILVPMVACLGIVFGGLMLTGVIDFNRYVSGLNVPEGYTVVPDVCGLDKEEAKAKLEKANLTVQFSKTEASDYIAINTVFLQNPEVGRWRKKNDVVYLDWINDTITKDEMDENVMSIPSLIGLTPEDAEVELLVNGFLGEIRINREYSDDYSENIIFKQDPPRGELYYKENTKNITVTITVSLGSKKFEMPTITGKTRTEAEKIISDLGLVAEFGGYVESDKPKDTVVSQTPKKGELVGKGDKIKYTLSKGPDSETNKDEFITVPDVVGMTKADATNKLKDLGFVVEAPYIEGGAKDVVASQSLEKGTSHKKGETIVIEVYKGTEESKTVTVNLNADGGTVSQTSKTVTVNAKYGTLPEPKKDGHTFDGWYTENSIKVTDSTTVTLSYDHTLKAKWVPKTFTVTLNGNGGTPAEKTVTVTYGKKYGEFLPSAPTLAGYNFAGWYTSATGGDPVAINDTVTLTGNQTLYAHWSQGTVTVMLDANGGDMTSDSILSVTYNGYYTGLTVPKLTGYSFEGWYLNSDYSGGEVTENTKVTKSNTHTLYAKWTPKTMTVTLNADGGSGVSSSITVTYGSKYSGLTDPTKTGYTFKGWVDKNGNTITSSSTVQYAENHTLTAKWTENQYSEWKDTLPSDVNENDYFIKTATQYRYRDKAFTESSSSSLSGWTQYSSTSSWGEYGAWSSWSTTAVTSSDSRQVEQKIVTDKDGYTEYRYLRYRKSGATNVHWCASCGYKYHGGTWYAQYTDWSTTKKSLTGDKGRCSHTNYEYVYWYGTSSNAWFFEESRWIEPVTHTEYRYRDRSKVYTYYYYKWGEWTEWSSNSVSSTNDRQVETRTIYSYRKK